MTQELIEAYELEGYENRDLSQKEIIKMLDEHGLGWEFDGSVNQGKILYAVDRGLDESTDTTGWKLFDVLAFLNY